MLLIGLDNSLISCLQSHSQHESQHLVFPWDISYLSSHVVIEVVVTLQGSVEVVVGVVIRVVVVVGMLAVYVGS